MKQLKMLVQLLLNNSTKKKQQKNDSSTSYANESQKDSNASKSSKQLHQLEKQYMQEKGVFLTFVRLFNSNRKGTVAARINVKNDDFYRVSENNFWPK